MTTNQNQNERSALKNTGNESSNNNSHDHEIGQTLAHKVEAGKQYAGEALVDARDHLQVWGSQARDYVKAHPGKSAGIAIGALGLVSMLCHRGSRQKAGHGGKALLGLLASTAIASKIHKKKERR